MKTFGELIKPYYKLDEAVHRFRERGIDVYCSDDIWHLVENKKLELSLIIDHEAEFISAEFVQPIHCNRDKEFRVSDDDYAWYTLDFSEDLTAASKAEHEINEGVFLIPLEFLEPEETIDKTLLMEPESIDRRLFELSRLERMVKSEAFKTSSESSPLIGSVVSINLATYRSSKKEQLSEWESFSTKTEANNPNQLDTEIVFALETDGKLFYPYKRRAPYFRDTVLMEAKLPNGIQFRPDLFLDEELIPSLLSDESFVLTKEALEKYFISTDDGDRHPKLKEQEKREQVLQELIDEVGEDEVRKLGREETWSRLNEREQYLFPLRSASTIKQFFRLQQIITYKPGRRKK